MAAGKTVKRSWKNPNALQPNFFFRNKIYSFGSFLLLMMYDKFHIAEHYLIEKLHLL
jgi:hypothetical protein